MQRQRNTWGGEKESLENILEGTKKNQNDWKTQVHHKPIHILVPPGSRENKSPGQVYDPAETRR